MSIKYHDGEQWRDSYPSPPLRRPVDGGSSGSAVNANWAQNDPTQPDYVKNRTHWVEGELSTIEWDGSTDGRECVSVLDDLTLCKLSDVIISTDELIGNQMYFSDGSSIAVAESDVMMDDDVHMYTVANLYCVMQTEIYGVTFPGTGMYAAVEDVHVTKIEYGKQTVHQIDRKFIPDDTMVVPLEASFTQNGSDYDGYAWTECDPADIIAAYKAGKHIILKCMSNSFVTLYLPLKYTDEYNTMLNFSASVPDEDGTVQHWFVAWLQHYGWTATVRVRSVLPEVTAANNGAFLRVVDGAYALVNLNDVSAPITDLTAAPTAKDYNRLLAALRAAGVLAE